MAPSTTSNSAASPRLWPSVRGRPRALRPASVAVHHQRDVPRHRAGRDAGGRAPLGCGVGGRTATCRLGLIRSPAAGRRSPARPAVVAARRVRGASISVPGRSPDRRRPTAPTGRPAATSAVRVPGATAAAPRPTRTPPAGARVRRVGGLPVAAGQRRHQRDRGRRRPAGAGRPAIAGTARRRTARGTRRAARVAAPRAFVSVPAPSRPGPWPRSRNASSTSAGSRPDSASARSADTSSRYSRSDGSRSSAVSRSVVSTMAVAAV